MGLSPASSAHAFFSDPIDRYTVGRTFLSWCHRGELVGSSVWARPDRADLRFLMSMWDLGPRLRPGCQAVTDVSRLESVDSSAFSALMATNRPPPGGVAAIRRHVLACQSNQAGALVAGFYLLLPGRLEHDVFNDRASAFAALAHPDAVAVFTELEELVGQAMNAAPILRELAELMKSNVRDATLMGAARKLGRSVRTLQRELYDAGTSFRHQRDKARAEEAQQLVAHTSLKLAEIAERVGCSSPSQLSKLIRRMTGAAPSAFRK